MSLETSSRILRARPFSKLRSAAEQKGTTTRKKIARKWRNRTVTSKRVWVNYLPRSQWSVIVSTNRRDFALWKIIYEFRKNHLFSCGLLDRHFIPLLDHAAHCPLNSTWPYLIGLDDEAIALRGHHFTLSF